MEIQPTAHTQGQKIHENTANGKKLLRLMDGIISIIPAPAKAFVCWSKYTTAEIKNKWNSKDML